MITWRRLAIGATAATVAFAALSLSASGLGQHPTGSDNPAPEPTAPPGQTGGELDPNLEVVHSWALAPAGADDPEGAGSRANLSYAADPGSVVEDAVTIFNYSNVELTFRVYATDAFNSPGGQLDLLPGSQAPTDVGSWVTLVQDNVTVPAGQKVTMPMTLTIPIDAAPGDHTGAILASNEALSDGEGGGVVTLDRRIGTRLYLRVNGPLRPELVIEDLATDYRPALNPFGGSALVTYRIQNRGNIRLAGSHTVSVTGPFGLSKRRLPAEEFPELLPGQGIDVTVKIDDVPALVLASTTVELVPAGGSGGEAVAASSRRTTTFAPPILVLVLLMVVLAIVVRRRYRRHRDPFFHTDGDEELEMDDDVPVRADVAVQGGPRRR